MPDRELLQAFVRTRTQRAFADLVHRHVDLVYSTAVRHARGEISVAEDITHQVFLELATCARRLVDHPCLAAWLYANTRFTALNTIRHDRRRTGRERDTEIPFAKGTPIADWNRIRPVIDDAIDELDDRDREMIVLRFLDRQSPAAIAVQLTHSESSVHTGIAHALEELDAALGRRGIPSTATALGASLTNATVAAPTAVTTATVTAVMSSIPGTHSASRVLLSVAQVVLACAAIAGVAITIGYFIGTQRERDRATTELAAHDREGRRQLEGVQQKLVTANRRVATLEDALLHESADVAAASTAPVQTTLAWDARIPAVRVLGQVKTPAMLELTGEVSLRDLITQLGGFTTMANPKAVKVQRRAANGETTVLTVDATADTPFMVQPNDVVYVPERVL